MSGGIFIRTVPNVMRHFGCTADDAQRYMDLRDEGYGREQAKVMAGLADPYEPSDQTRAAASPSPALDKGKQ